MREVNRKFHEFLFPFNLLRCGRIIEVRRTRRLGPTGLEGGWVGGRGAEQWAGSAIWGAVLLNTNKFALVTKDQMSSPSHTEHTFFS